MRKLRRIFRSRFVILLPMVAVAVLSALYFLERSPREVAKQFADQLRAAPEDKVEILVERLGRLDQAGIPELVRCLASGRRVIVHCSRNELEQAFRKWTAEETPKTSANLYTLAKALAERVDQFGPTSRLIAASFAQRILRALIEIPAQEKGNQRLETTQFCEEILRKTEGERIVANSPQRLNEMHTIAGSAEPTRVFAPNPQDQEYMLAANERNRQKLTSQKPAGHSESATEFYDPYSSPRAELLYAVHQSRRNSFPPQPPSEIGRQTPEQLTGLELLAIQNSTRNTPEPDYEPGGIQRAEVAERIASQFGQDFPPKSEAEEEILPQLPAYEPNAQNSAAETLVFETQPLEKTPLGETSIDEIPNLPTADLIRLLQHPNRSVQAVAEKRLRDRDHFQDEHIALAYRLYHPNAEIRKGVIDALLRSPSVQPISWLMELLRDSDSDVRLTAITFIATAKDKSLMQEVLQRAKKDSDPRINGLIEKLERIQRIGDRM